VVHSRFRGDDRVAAFAVYDGHGGDDVSEFLKYAMLPAIIDQFAIRRDAVAQAAAVQAQLQADASMGIGSVPPPSSV